MKRIRGKQIGRSMAPKAKIVKKEYPNDDVLSMTDAHNNPFQSPALKPSVEITQCISYQKFRYSGENRPGKKYQEKEFMTLKLCNLSDKVVRVVIICTDADNRELIHPNGLVGKDCHDGIYDKEYAVTKPLYLIKIPYLRTERIKTKKNEYSKIQSVLSERASHLPSPYRERCLSQCTDKYTSSRKFDTTKVCLGVIVTVQSHQGPFNGSLHAISHVVRNASEKTSLKILKLSQDMVQGYGGYIDIFTTEDGPAIEPDKYIVYVSCKSDIDGEEGWVSDKHQPMKEEILYKRVITYEVPPFAPNPSLAHQMEATLHLECPQSNQFCEYKFFYGPHGGIVIESDPHYNGNKYYTEQDIKPKKRLLLEPSENDGNTEAIKANLKSKLTARQEIPFLISEQIYLDTPGESQEEGSHYIIETPQNYTGEHSVLIRHQDPHTGESSYLLDMDASKNLNNNLNSGQQYVQQYSIDSNSLLQGMKSVRGKRSPYQPHSQDMQVVATGYSDAVPPNTTVLIYTTNGAGFTEQVAIDGGEQVEIHELSDEEAAGSSIIVNGESITNEVDNNDTQTTVVQNGTSEQVIRRDLIAEKRLANTKENFKSINETMADRSRGVNQTVSDHGIVGSESRQQTVRTSYSACDVHTPNTSKNPSSERFSPTPTSSPSTIPPLRRMLIPHKQTSSASAWEVGNEDDQSESYNLMFGMDKPPALVKQEPADEETHRQVNKYPQSSTFQHRYIAQKQIHHLENGGNNATNSEKNLVKEMETPGKPENANLASMEIDLQGAIVENLPTMKVFELAEIIEKGLPSTTVEHGEADG
ncbi:unnamed protein product [Lymnaea stagnalis]|uniref:RHD domain-containing protein n=1 Tax=Lymnaea stagnalis TaxID=6523 RepID=A0AAV2H0F6_LYMST